MNLRTNTGNCECPLWPCQQVPELYKVTGLLGDITYDKVAPSEELHLD